MPSCGDRIKEVRKIFRETQKEFAENVNISQAHLSNIEKGKDKPSDKLLRVISAEYEVSFEWLKIGEGKMVMSVDYPETKELLSSLKIFLSNGREFDHFYSSEILQAIPKFLSWNNRDDLTKTELLTIQTELLKTIFQYKSYLESETHNVAESGDIREKIDELFDIKRFYEEKILNSLNHFFNVLIGTGK